jgi:hypothetical protein
VMVSKEKEATKCWFPFFIHSFPLFSSLFH